MKDVYICKISDLKVGKVLKGFYYCNDKNVKYSKNGDMYIDLLLSDNKDFIYAKIWKHSEYFNSKFESVFIMFFKFKSGTIFFLRGTIIIEFFFNLLFFNSELKRSMSSI